MTLYLILKAFRKHWLYIFKFDTFRRNWLYISNLILQLFRSIFMNYILRSLRIYKKWFQYAPGVSSTPPKPQIPNQPSPLHGDRTARVGGFNNEYAKGQMRSCLTGSNCPSAGVKRPLISRDITCNEHALHKRSVVSCAVAICTIT